MQDGLIAAGVCRKGLWMLENVSPRFDPLRLEERSPVGDAVPDLPGGQPYYIVAPRYIRTSAGVKALYLLCHCLNRAGQEAFMVVYPDRPNPDRTKLDLLIPRLSSEQMQKHVKAGVSPIIVYPETIGGNPLRGRSIVRYVLNFPGLLAGDRVYQKNEMVFGYSSVLAEAGGAPGRVLFIPTSDTKLFSPGPPQPRQGSCFYAMKYQLVHQGALFPVTQGSVEITRDRPDSQQPEEIAALFRRSELFYAYENTALAPEAALCLCPTVFLPNPWLTDGIALRELGTDGFAWGTDPAEIARAKATVHRARERYLATYAAFWDQLADFIGITQARAAQDAASSGFPRQMMNFLRWGPRFESSLFMARRAGEVLRHEGPLAALRKSGRMLVRAGRHLAS